MYIHILVMLPGAREEAVWLLRAFAAHAKKIGARKITGPHWGSAEVYGGYVLGAEPCHPHWDVEGTEAYVRAGYTISFDAVLMERDLGKTIVPEPFPDGFQVEEATTNDEYAARTFGYIARREGKEVAHCYTRLYPDLRTSNASPVGQIGHVGTHDDYRGRGFARILVKRCRLQLKEWGAEMALIGTGLNNRPALRAYSRVGYEPRYSINVWAEDLDVHDPARK